MNPIISFDLDGTLMKPGFGDKVWLEGLPKIYSKHYKIDYHQATSFFKNAYDTIGSDKREWYDLSYWIDKYQLPITPNELLDQYESSIALFDDVEYVLDTLSKDYILIISSGAMREFIVKELGHTGISHYFSHLFSSTTDTDTVKKDPVFYTMISKNLHRSPQEIIHIGDDFDYDYHSSKLAGFQAYYLNRTKKSKQPHILSSLNEFLAVIKNNYTK